MGKTPRSRTSALLLLVMAMLVGDGVRAGSSVLENAVDQEDEVRALFGQHQRVLDNILHNNYKYHTTLHKVVVLRVLLCCSMIGQ